MTKAVKNYNGGKPFTFFTNMNDELTKIISYEVFDIECYKPLVEAVKGKTKPVILDIGAHVGMASIYFAEMIKDAYIISVEPNPDNFQCLYKNSLTRPQIHPINTAISAMTGMRKMGASHWDRLSESFYYEDGEKIDVLTKTMEDLFAEENLTHVDAMKIDVEGAEYEIFLSPSFKSVADKIDFIIGESHYLIGLPPMIPHLLKDNFDAKFLDVNNMQLTYGINVKGIVYNMLCDVPTMFVANRKKSDKIN